MATSERLSPPKSTGTMLSFLFASRILSRQRDIGCVRFLILRSSRNHCAPGNCPQSNIDDRAVAFDFAAHGCEQSLCVVGFQLHGLLVNGALQRRTAVAMERLIEVRGVGSFHADEVFYDDEDHRAAAAALDVAKTFIGLPRPLTFERGFGSAELRAKFPADRAPAAAQKVCAGMAALDQFAFGGAHSFRAGGTAASGKRAELPKIARIGELIVTFDAHAGDRSPCAQTGGGSVNDAGLDDGHGQWHLKGGAAAMRHAHGATALESFGALGALESAAALGLESDGRAEFGINGGDVHRRGVVVRFDGDPERGGINEIARFAGGDLDRRSHDGVQSAGVDVINADERRHFVSRHEANSADGNGVGADDDNAFVQEQGLLRSAEGVHTGIGVGRPIRRDGEPIVRVEGKLLDVDQHVGVGDRAVCKNVGATRQKDANDVGGGVGGAVQRGDGKHIRGGIGERFTAKNSKED
jgi:hypothetical protein